MAPAQGEQTLLLQEPLPCNPAAETALRPLPWHFESSSSHRCLLLLLCLLLVLLLCLLLSVIYIYIYTYTSLSLSLSTYIYIYIYIYTHTYIHNIFSRGVFFHRHQSHVYLTPCYALRKLDCTVTKPFGTRDLAGLGSE